MWKILKVFYGIVILLLVPQSVESKEKEGRDSLNLANSRKVIFVSAAKKKNISNKMIAFLSLISNISSGLTNQNFEVVQRDTGELAELTKHNFTINKNDLNPGFLMMKRALSKNVARLNLSVKKKEYTIMKQDFNLVLKSCVSCHSSFAIKLLSSDNERR